MTSPVVRTLVWYVKGRGKKCVGHGNLLMAPELLGQLMGTPLLDLGFPHSYMMSGEVVEKLQEYVRHELDPDIFSYFIECRPREPFEEIDEEFFARPI